ncbi:hypothetical protein EVAR_94789_1 [Eumeta japonica]|uniref:Uncharacterized protein n=1 Tax=Eumeta variegata TaxID=151549 RepID=A0A4C1UH52_EUMVA|nr:hypothetical protein EVAR_94789_1 [Eumeta japonica]
MFRSRLSTDWGSLMSVVIATVRTSRTDGPICSLKHEQYSARNFATVNFVMKASQWCGERKSGGALNLCITSFSGNSEQQRFLAPSKVNAQMSAPEHAELVSERAGRSVVKLT